jgi:hypothetical protein
LADDFLVWLTSNPFPEGYQLCGEPSQSTPLRRANFKELHKGNQANTGLILRQTPKRHGPGLSKSRKYADFGFVPLSRPAFIDLSKQESQLGQQPISLCEKPASLP